MTNKQPLIEHAIAKFADKLYSPVSLYLKQHNKTGLKYFGKTSAEDPTQYRGSGKYWALHLSAHGNDVTTLWHQEFADLRTLVEYAINFSVDNDIVYATNEAGDKIFANLRIEDGLDGGRHTKETKKLIGIKGTGRKIPKESIERRTKTRAKNIKVIGAKISKGNTGLKRRAGTGALISARKKELMNDEKRGNIGNAKKGNKNPAWKGYIQTPDGVFESTMAAAKYYSMTDVMMSRRCASENPLFSGWKRVKEIAEDCHVITKDEAIKCHQ